MEVNFEKEYLFDLYTKGRSDDKKHRYQPSVVKKYVNVVKLMTALDDVNGLRQYNSLNYERLHGDKEGCSSVRVNDKYRIEFTEETEEGKSVASICNIIELSNHYQ